MVNVKTKPFGDYNVAMAVPFTRDGELDKKGIADVVKFLVDNEVPLIVVSGTTAEQHLTTVSERIQLYQMAAKNLGGRCKMFAGVAGGQTKDAVQLARAAQEAGAIGLMLGFPPYIRPSQAEAVEYVRQVANACDLSIILYNNVPRTGFDLSVESMALLAREYPQQVVGVKEVSDPAKAQERARQTKEASQNMLALYPSFDAALFDHFLVGFDGLCSIVGNVFPREMHEITRLLLKGELPAAKQQLTAMAPVFKALFAPSLPVGIKFGMQYVGVNAGFARQPLGILTDAQAQAIRQAIDDFKARK